MLDLFGGSGSTLIGAEQSGRNAFLMELDSLYSDVICQRYFKFTGTEPVRERDGATWTSLKPVLKRCRFCRRELPITRFHRSGTNKLASRCKDCHGVAIRQCKFCNRLFVGKSGRKACSELCGQLLRAPTFLVCKNCGQLFGPADPLETKVLFEELQVCSGIYWKNDDSQNHR